MSRLSDVISRVVELEDGPNGIDLHRAAAQARALIDSEDAEALIIEALVKRIKSQATRTRRDEVGSALKGDPVLPFPDLRVRHALDEDGRWLVETGKMKEHQFRRLIDIRRKQLNDDWSYLKVIEDAYQRAVPIWREQPGLTFDEVCAVLIEKAA